MTAIGDIRIEVRLALQSLGQGDREGAERRLTAAMKAQPRDLGVLSILGAFLTSEKRYREAEPILRTATKSPLVSDATCFHYGLTLQHLDRPRDAAEAFGKALAKNPNNADAWFGRGSVLLEGGKPQEALAQFDRALALNPDSFLAYQNKGAALLELRRYAESVLNQDACLRINPKFAPAFIAKAEALAILKRFESALTCVDAGLSLAPDHAIGWRARAQICLGLRRIDEAIDSMRKAVSFRPAETEWRDTLIETKLRACQWSDYSGDFAALGEMIRTNGAVLPNLCVMLPFSAAEQRRAAAVRVGREARRRNAISTHPANRRSQPIRLAYLSNELRRHPTAILLVGALERHDRRRFEITVFNDEPRDGSLIQKRVIDAVDEFIDVFEIDDERLLDLIKAKRIDILVNLDFPSKAQRNSVFSRRPAPVQVNHLGYPGSAAVGGCDYLIADAIVIPPEHKQHYLEKIAYLPDCYQPNDATREISARSMRRADMGLPEDGFVFCCFNRSQKLNPEMLDGWSRILLATPGSVLWLLRDNPAAVKNLGKEAAARGVDPARLVFADSLPLDEHLARHRLADLFLDTLPYNAHTTASDALWAGLPVLTRIGETFAGRVGASLLAAIGLPELIVSTQQDYEAMAIDLAANRDRLRALADKLAANRLTTPLFDTKLYAARLDAAFEAMHARRLAGLPPDDIQAPA